MSGPDTQVRQREFRKELGLRSLVMGQVLNIVGLTWVGVAAKLGPAHVAFWLLGIVLFYLPSAAVVIYLNRVHTLEGGLYEWARLGFNEFAGFLAAWNMWLNMLLIISFGGIQSLSGLVYVLGPSASWMADSKWMNAGVTILLMAAVMLVALRGLGVAKWIQDLGGAFLIIVFAALIALPFHNHVTGRPTEYPPFTLALPAISVLSLNILGKMSFAALSGFDSMAIFAGEARNAVKTIAWSVIIAAPIIALMFVMGTSSVVALVPKEKIDLVMPMSQALSLGTRPGDIGASLIPLVLVALLYSLVASQVLTFGLTSRLPLVAGWDNLLPAWFGRLHPRYRTPVNSILFVGLAAFAVAMAAVAGSGQQEAFQMLQNIGAIFYAIAYLMMFALPLAGKQREIEQPPLWLRAASVTGFIMTAIYLVLAVFPIIDVPSPWIFTAKVGGFVLGCQLGGAALFWSYHRRAKRV